MCPQVTENVFNMKFEGLSGPIEMDGRGDRKADYR